MLWNVEMPQSRLVMRFVPTLLRENARRFPVKYARITQNKCAKTYQPWNVVMFQNVPAMECG